MTKKIQNINDKFLIGALIFAVAFIAYLLGKNQSMFLGSTTEQLPLPTIEIPTDTPISTPTDTPTPTKIFIPLPTRTPTPTPTPTLPSKITIAGQNEVLHCDPASENAIRDVVRRLGIDDQSEASCILNHWPAEVCSSYIKFDFQTYQTLKTQYCK